MAAVKVSVSLDDELLRSVDDYADDNGISRSAFISQACRQYLVAAANMPNLESVLSSYAKVMSGIAGLTEAEAAQVAAEGVEAGRAALAKLTG